MELDKSEFVENWRHKVADELKDLCPGDIEEINFRFHSMDINDKYDSGVENKENAVATTHEKVKTASSSLLNLSNVQQEIGSQLSAAITGTDTDDNEKPAYCEKYLLLIDDKSTEYWDFTKMQSVKIESRLLPQKFHHHTIKPSYLKANKQYRFHIDFKCPSSATDEEIHRGGLTENERIKNNALRWRFSRVGIEKGSQRHVLCRLCASKRWIPESQFVEHLGLSHGIVHIPEVGNVAMPPPAALFKHTPGGRLKFYYSKCPKCLCWVRLGKLADVERVSRGVRRQDRLLERTAVVGLYTPYFRHFLACSLA